MGGGAGNGARVGVSNGSKKRMGGHTCPLPCPLLLPHPLLLPCFHCCHNHGCCHWCCCGGGGGGGGGCGGGGGD